MEFKYVSTGTFREHWRSLKTDCLKIKRAKHNTKLFRDLDDLNRYFGGMLVDLRSAAPRTQKLKYAGLFHLPDGFEYFIKFGVGQRRCKLSIATKNTSKDTAEKVLQQLAFLLTN